MYFVVKCKKKMCVVVKINVWKNEKKFAKGVFFFKIQKKVQRVSKFNMALRQVFKLKTP